MAPRDGQAALTRYDRVVKATEGSVNAANRLSDVRAPGLRDRAA